MIRYPTSTVVIKHLISKRQPFWQAKATERTNYHRQERRFIKAGESLPNGQKAKDFWGEVKSVFVTVQHSKCAYCESKIEPSVMMWDLEHFRPQRRVYAWQYTFSTGPAMPEGYYLLAYNFRNYVASCKTCNMTYKQSYFPIAHSRVQHGKNVAAHQTEGAYLIYPLGDQAEDPEQHIAFEGVQAVPKTTRGQLLIDFFELNREGLQRSRAEWLIHTVWDKIKALDNKLEAMQKLEWILSHKAPHTNCTRCFLALCLSNPQEAARKYAEMERLLQKSIQM